MPIRFLLATLFAALSSGVLYAQDYTGFPEDRMRQGRPDNQNVFVPEEIYPQNRVVIRTTEIMSVGRGMQISGDILTDFDADSVPVTEAATVPRGQLKDINVTVELFHYDVLVERDLKTNKAKTPKIDPTDEGRHIAGQSVTVQPKQSSPAGYGLATFTLPVLNKPLAPGMYKLVARVRFKSHHNDLQRAFKWMSDWYGARPTYDEETFETYFEPVMPNATLHEEIYQFLLNDMGQVKTENIIWIGEIWKNGVLELVPPERGTDRKPANFAIWSYHAGIAEQVLEFEDQLDNVDKVIDRELELKLGTDGATEEMKEKWRKEAEQDKFRIRRDNKDLIEKYGGRLNKEELKMLTTVKPARMAVMDQVMLFHEYLTCKYWVLVDGLLTYGGWHTVNVPGYNIWEAVTTGDVNISTTRREAEEARKKALDGGVDGVWDQRREQWRFLPPEVTRTAFAYLKKKEQTADWDAKNFTKKKGQEVDFLIEEWEKLREDFIVEFYSATEKLLAEVTTTGVYSSQVWPEALSAAKEARDDVIRLTYSWEHLIRTDEKIGDASEVVQEEWSQSPIQFLEGVELAPYYKKGTAQPGTLKLRFESSCTKVKSIVGVGNFSVAYRRALEAETVDQKNLPGKRPPSAPTQE